MRVLTISNEFIERANSVILRLESEDFVDTAAAMRKVVTEFEEANMANRRKQPVGTVKARVAAINPQFIPFYQDSS